MHIIAAPSSNPTIEYFSRAESRTQLTYLDNTACVSVISWSNFVTSAGLELSPLEGDAGSEDLASPGIK